MAGELRLGPKDAETSDKQLLCDPARCGTRQQTLTDKARNERDKQIMLRLEQR